MHIDLIGPYNKSLIQQQPCGDIIKKDVSIAWMNMVHTDTYWFEIINITTFSLGEVTYVNGEYIYKSYVRVSHIFNNMCLRRYPHPRKVVIDKRILV